jgi:hypothetical protein
VKRSGQANKEIAQMNSGTCGGKQYQGRRRGTLALACIAGMAATGQQAGAAQRTWLPSNGAFSLGFSWAEGVAPGASDNALFDTGSPAYSVGFSLADVTTSQLSVLNAHPQFSFSGHTYTVTGSTFVGYNVGDLGNLDLIGAGTLNPGNMTLGRDNPSLG